MVAGMREANAFSLPPGTDCLTLPALRKDEFGRYQSRNLDVSLEEVIAVRAGVIRAAMEAFSPDVLVVDKVPRGAMAELDPTLQFLRSRNNTYCILGLRDVLDDPAAVRKEWAKSESEDAVIEYYDEVWVYGDPRVYDVARECGFSRAVTSKLRFTGYLDQRDRLLPAGLSDSAADFRPYVLCSVGGGQDGATLAKLFVQTRLPAGLTGVIVTGSFMPPELLCEVRHLASRNPHMRVLGFVNEPASLVRDAERLVIMGGYNSVCEALSFEKPTLIVPRVKPRTEQLIRAQAFAAQGLVEFVLPDQISSSTLEDWLSREVVPPKVRGKVNFNGLAVLPTILGSLHASRESAVSCVRSVQVSS